MKVKTEASNYSELNDKILNEASLQHFGVTELQSRIQIVRPSNLEHTTGAPNPFLRSTCADVKECSSLGLQSVSRLQTAPCNPVQLYYSSVVCQDVVRGVLPSGGNN